MTELYIDHRLVVLPKSLNLKVIEENPFFSKSGKYTLDVTLSLIEDENAKVYEHIHRMNVVDRIALERSAILIVDNKVALNGTEVITEITESSVKLQLLSGNSELNFLIGGDMGIRTLDLGRAEPFTKSDDLYNSLAYTYPSRNYHFLPYYTGERDIIFDDPNHRGTRLSVGNDYLLDAWPHDSNKPKTDIHPGFQCAFSMQTAQPYFCFIVSQVVKAIGYTLSYNCIANHPVFKNAYMVNGIQSYEFAKMLPDWTVTEFMEEIEHLFDCCFVVDEYTKNVKLLFNYQAEEQITGKQVVSIEVDDEYTCENEADNTITVRNGNIGYALDSNDYHKYMRLEDRIRDISYSVRWDATSLDAILEYLNRATVDDYKPSIQIWSTNVTPPDDLFIIYNLNGRLTLRKVESFRNITNNEKSNDLNIEFNIIPAGFVYAKQRITYNDANVFAWVQIPIAGEYDNLLFDRFGQASTETGNIVEDPEYDIQELVEGDQTFSEVTPSKIRLALYTGLQSLDISDDSDNVSIPATYFPMSYVESLAEYVEASRKERHFGTKYVNPFRLSYLQEQIYDKAKNIDTTKTYKLKYKDPGKTDIRSKFIASNRAFRCAKIERTITIDGFMETITGDFYPYKQLTD